MANEHRKLAFYSDQEATSNREMDERLRELIGLPRPRIGYVASEPDPPRHYYRRTQEHYARLGAIMDCYFDADYVSDVALTERLLGCDAIHLSGGNTFTFIAWLKGCNLARQLIDYSLRGGVLIGVSAGAMIMTPSVISADLCGDVRLPGSNDDAGLHLVDFHFWPHFQIQFQEGQGPMQQLPALRQLYACPDGSGILVDGTAIELFGQVQSVSGSEQFC